MSLPLLVLALVAGRPDHGYRLHARIAEELGLPDVAEPSHVYAALAALARCGLIRGRTEHASGRRREIYSATAAGRERLAAWLERPGDDRTVLRRPALLKAAVWLYLDERPEPRTLRAERAVRARRIAARPRALLVVQPVLADLLRARERRHLAIELSLLDRLVPPESPDRRDGGAQRRGTSPRPTGSGSR